MCKVNHRADLNNSKFKTYATFKNMNKESTHLAPIKLSLAVPIVIGTFLTPRLTAPCPPRCYTPAWRDLSSRRLDVTVLRPLRTQSSTFAAQRVARYTCLRCRMSYRLWGSLDSMMSSNIDYVAIRPPIEIFL